MKKIAFYLPQFHAIPENDEWWGEGFTEWENVKKSTPKFRNHNQPEVPYRKRYYSLMDEQIQIEQVEMAKKYGIDGFCYYHYWFEGKLLLEKPMENMLRNKNIDLPFCVCWANETWARTWDGKEKKILIKQNYNEDTSAWKRHFDYLLPFFQDERYIKHGNKPMIIFYKPHLITNCVKLIKYWDELAIQSGFDGLYWGYQHHSSFNYEIQLRNFDFGIEFEPFYTVWESQKQKKTSFLKRLKKRLFNLPTIYDYDEIWQQILNRIPEKNNVMPGAFTAWDNTPRKGNKAIIFYKATPDKFNKYLGHRIKVANEVYNADYLFINAWNEWAEGAHLEPDEINGLGYLEAFKAAVKVNEE